MLDARRHRTLERGRSFTYSHLFHRAVWNIVWFCFCAWTPPQFNGWRCLVLRAFGARIGSGARVYASARVWYPPNLTMGQYSVLGRGVVCYSMAHVRIGARAVISQRAHLCTGTHRVDDPGFQLIARPISIGAGAWIAAEAFVGPGVIVGEGAVLGARGVTFRDLSPWTIYSGNPARVLRRRYPDRPPQDDV